MLEGGGILSRKRAAAVNHLQSVRKQSKGSEEHEGSIECLYFQVHRLKHSYLSPHNQQVNIRKQ